MYRCITIQVYRDIEEKAMEWFKPVSIENLDPKIRVALERKSEQRKYREKVIETAVALNAGERFAVPYLGFMELYAEDATFRVWASRLNKKYPERQYVSVVPDKDGNMWMCRLQ
jgi:hypothetical protein